MYLIKQRLIRSSAYFVFGLHATLLLLAAPTARSQGSLPYKVGVAVENITPCAQNFTNCSPSDIPISSTVKTTGGSATVATGVGTDYDGTRSELTVRAFVIEDARGQRVVLISADLLGFSANFVRDVRARVVRSGFAPSAVMINATHTHNAVAVKALVGFNCLGFFEEAPVIPEYVEGVKNKIVTAVERAVSNMQPATLHFGRTSSSIAAYRRKDQAQGGTIPPFGQPLPQHLDILEAKNSSGSPVAIAFFIGCHTTTMYGSNLISADFPSEARKRVEAATGATAVFVQGFGGDVEAWRYSQQVPTRKSDTGKELSDNVLSARGGVVPLQGELQAETSIVNLPINSKSQTWGITSPANLKWAHDGSPTLAAELQMIKVGPQSDSPTSWTLLATSHEIVSEFTGAVRARLSDHAQLTLAGYSNAVESYLPTERMISSDKGNCGGSPNGGYEGCYSFSVYYRGLPAWTNADFLNPVASLSQRLSVSLADDFSSAQLDQTKWNNHLLGMISCGQPHDPLVGIRQVSGELEILPLSNAGGYHYNGYVSSKTYDFTGKQAIVEVKEAPAGISAEMLMSIGPDGLHLYRYDVQGTAEGIKLYAHHPNANGGYVYADLGTYNPQTQRLLRIRHTAADDKVHWDVSGDGITWTNDVFSVKRLFDLTASRVELVAGTWRPSANAGRARFDNFTLK